MTLWLLSSLSSLLLPAVAVAVVVVVVLLTKFGLSDKVALLASLSHAADIGGQSVI